MLERPNEEIDISVNFINNKIVPTHFRWKGCTYKIEKLNMVHKERDGDDKIYYFSVSNNANFFKLAFFTRDLSWHIQELFYE